MTTERDIRNQIAYAREEGIAEGEAKGEAKARLQMAKDLKTNGVSLDIIVKCTGLPIETVESC